MKRFVFPRWANKTVPLVGVVLGAAAMEAYRRLPPHQARWAAPALLALAICFMHFTAMGAVSVEYDPTVDIAYVYVDGAGDRPVDHTDDVSRGRQYDRGIDQGADGSIIGYEFMNASRGIDLDGLPHRAELAALFTRVGSIRALDAAG